MIDAFSSLQPVPVFPVCGGTTFLRFKGTMVKAYTHVQFISIITHLTFYLFLANCDISSGHSCQTLITSSLPANFIKVFYVTIAISETRRLTCVKVSNIKERFRLVERKPLSPRKRLQWSVTGCCLYFAGENLCVTKIDPTGISERYTLLPSMEVNIGNCK